MSQPESKPDGKPAAEAEVAGDQTRTEELYDRYAERVRELFDTGQEKSQVAMERAMEAARVQLSAAGDFSVEQGEAFAKFMRRDLDQTAEDMRALGQEAGERLSPSRVGAGALSSVARLLEATGSALQNLSRRAEQTLHFNTGEITAAGTLTCTQCRQKVQLKHSSRIPPCPSCHGSEFRKSY